MHANIGRTVIVAAIVTLAAYLGIMTYAVLHRGPTPECCCEPCRCPQCDCGAKHQTPNTKHE